MRVVGSGRILRMPRIGGARVLVRKLAASGTVRARCGLEIGLVDVNARHPGDSVPALGLAFASLVLSCGSALTCRQLST